MDHTHIMEKQGKVTVGLQFHISFVIKLILFVDKIFILTAAIR